MSELRELLKLWDETRAAGEDVVLVTVVRVEGSSYRKPGARMLISKSGRRSGMVSGGCLEAEISRKAWWLTGSGPSLQRYGTFFDEDSPSPQSMGCGGTVHLLFERGDSAAIALEVLEAAKEERRSFALITVIRSDDPDIAVGLHFALRDQGDVIHTPLSLRSAELKEFSVIAFRALEKRESEYLTICPNGKALELFVEYISPPPALFVFGAGDDAFPVVEFAHMMGWHTTVSDARSHLATKARFPKVDALVVLKSGFDISEMEMRTDDCAVIMTHSYMQDRALLAQLLPRNFRYVGILGPRRRTSRLLSEVASGSKLNVDECQRRLHSPVGLNLGANNPVEIALSIIAEIQASICKSFPADSRPTGHASTIIDSSQVHA